MHATSDEDRLGSLVYTVHGLELFIDVLRFLVNAHVNNGEGRRLAVIATSSFTGLFGSKRTLS